MSLEAKRHRVHDRKLAQHLGGVLPGTPSNATAIIVDHRPHCSGEASVRPAIKRSPAGHGGASDNGNGVVSTVPCGPFTRVEGEHIWHYVRKPFKLEENLLPEPNIDVVGVPQNEIDNRTREWQSSLKTPNQQSVGHVCKDLRFLQWKDELPQSIADRDVQEIDARYSLDKMLEENKRRSRVWDKIKSQGILSDAADDYIASS